MAAALLKLWKPLTALKGRAMASTATSKIIADFEAMETLRYPNGDKVQPLFSLDEYNRRLTTLRSKMAESNVDASILTSVHNIAYFSNFVYCSFGRPYAQVITQDKNVTVSALVDGGQPGRVSIGDNLVYTDWKKTNYLTALKEIAGNAKTIAIEHDFVNLQTLKRFQDTFGMSGFEDISDVTMKMRMIKSPEELEFYRKSARIADLGGFAVKQVIEEGIPEYEVAMHGTRAMVKEIAKSFGAKSEIRDSWIWLQSGPQNTDGAHNPLTNR